MLPRNICGVAVCWREGSNISSNCLTSYQVHRFWLNYAGAMIGLPIQWVNPQSTCLWKMAFQAQAELSQWLFICGVTH